MQTPTTRYAKSGDIRVAYQVVGQGPVDLVLVPGFISNLEVQWEDAGFAHLLQRLGSFARLIVFDKRGTGLSDRVDPQHLPSLETRMDDVRAVMDAAGSGRAVLLGASEGGPMTILFAATYPERTRALVLYGSYAHFHTFVMGRDALEQFIGGVEANWGTGASAARFAPEQAREESFRNWWGRYERLSCSPSAAVALARMNAAIDVRSVLSTIRVPTLVIHRSEDVRIKLSGGVYLAKHMSEARFVELPGRDHPIWTGEVDRVLDEIEEFVTGERPKPDHDRVLATILVARLVSPARLAAQAGDRAWSERLERFRRAAAELIARHRGQLIPAGSEEVGGHFDGPARAVRCAITLGEAAQALKLPIAAGVHAGEITLRDGQVAGVALHVTERIAEEAPAGVVLVSRVVADLVAGSGLHFAEHPSLQVEGIEGTLRLLMVVPEHHLEPAEKVTSGSADLDALSAREREVLALIAEGLSNAVIAQRLRLSEHTVKRHVANILMKLDLPTRAAAAALAARRST